MNTYNFLANVVLFLHVLFMAFVVGGLALILWGGLRGWSWVRNFWFRLFHLAMIGIVVVEAAFGWRCPLTTWEEQLRIAGGTPLGEYRDSQNELYNFYFAQDNCGRFLQNLIFFNLWPQEVFPYLYVTIGLAILASFLFVRPRWPWRRVTATIPTTAPPVPNPEIIAKSGAG
jgi:hypothetical protein